MKHSLPMTANEAARKGQAWIGFVPPAECWKFSVLWVHAPHVFFLSHFSNHSNSDANFVGWCPAFGSWTDGRADGRADGRQAGETVLLEGGNAEEVIFVVRGRASITRRGVEVSAWDHVYISM